MSSRLAFGGFTLAAIAAVAGVYLCCPANTPSLEAIAAAEPGAQHALCISPSQIDFGTLCLGESKTLPVTLRNQSREALEILRCETTCDCAHARYDRNRLSVGERIEAQITVKAAAESKFTGDLRITFSFDVGGNQKKREQTELVATVQVVSQRNSR